MNKLKKSLPESGFLALGIVFLVLGVSNNTAFIAIGAAFIAIGAATTLRRNSAGRNAE